MPDSGLLLRHGNARESPVLAVASVKDKIRYLLQTVFSGRLFRGRREIRISVQHKPDPVRDSKRSCT
jgi:hypothetical protein